MGFEFKEIDHGLEKLVRMLKREQAKGHYVKVGMVGDAARAKRSDGATNLEVALWSEYGTRHAPARPFIGPSFEKNRQKYERELAAGLEKVYRGKLDLETLLGRIGAQAAADVKKYVTQGTPVPPPNAPSTVAAKGSDRTLVDSGQMIGSVAWELGREGES